MAELRRLTKDEWDALEPLLAEADKVAHQRFMESPAAKALLMDSQKTPGYQLLQRLKELEDEAAIQLFRAVEMYHHELTRADIIVAFLRGRDVGRAESGAG